jgi:hypothetical protein
VTKDQLLEVRKQLCLDPCLIYSVREVNGRVVLKVVHLSLDRRAPTATGLYVCPPNILETDGPALQE